MMRGKQLLVLAFLVVTIVLLLPGGRTIAEENAPPTPDASFVDSSWQSSSAAELFSPDEVVAPTVLYDQLDHIGGSGISSQEYGPGWETWDCQGADDFVIPSGIGYWKVITVEVAGTYNKPSGVAVDSVTVQFYVAAITLPQTLVYSATVVPLIDMGGAFVIVLDTPALLAPDTYWLSMQANMNYSPGYKQWYWRQRTVQSNNASAWQNPGGGQHKGCLTWGARVAECGVGTDPDLPFKLSGMVIPENPLPVTTGLTPRSVLGSKAFTLTIDGRNFVLGALVGWSGLDRAATYVNSTRLQVAIPASDVSTSNTTVSVTVFNPAPGGGRSNAQTFYISPQVFLPLVMRN
jgi:hypothetical protein